MSADIYYLVHGHTDEATKWESPFFNVLSSDHSLRLRLKPAPTCVPFPILNDLMDRGMTDYAVFPNGIRRSDERRNQPKDTAKWGFLMFS